MPVRFAKKTTTTKRAPRKYTRKMPRKTRMYKSVRDIASCSVVRTLTPANANQIYSFDTIRLSDYQRAVAVAANYQRFRITGIKLTWKPVFDTYALPTVGGYAKPNLYYIIDKSGSIPDNVTLEGLKQSGAKVRAIDEKPISVRWRPSVLTENQAYDGQTTFSGPSGYKTSQWLSTNQNNTNSTAFVANQTNHLGIKFYIEQQGNGGQQVATPFPMDIEVEFQFIKPMIAGLVSSLGALGISYATVDNSPDGVVGGTDGV